MNNSDLPSTPLTGAHAPAVETYLTEHQTAAWLKVSTRTLQRWRLEGTQGLPFRRFGGVVRYAQGDVARWAAAQTRQSTSDNAA